MRKRATAVIVKQGKVLLFRRVKQQKEYYIFPGGGIDEGETIEEALRREVLEETSLGVVSMRHLFTVRVGVPEFVTIHEGYREEHVFLVEEYSGVPELSGPEKERSSQENQYHLEWKTISEIGALQNLYPMEVAKLLPPMLK